MSEIEKLKEELEQTRLAYEVTTQINHLKTGFLGRIAHELRSPLASLMGLHQLILTDLCESPEEERECVAQAYQAAKRLLKIIDDVVSVSKIEYGTIPLELEKVSIAKVFADLEQLTHLQAVNRNLNLEIVTPVSDLSFVGDYQRLLSVLILLVDGSISYLEQGKIQVLAKLSDTQSQGLIQIQFDCPLEAWSLEKNLEVSEPNFPIETSLYLKFLLSEKLIKMMQGEIQLSELSPHQTTQIQILLPLGASQMLAE